MMRKGLSTEKLKTIYRNIAGRYDFQHGLVTARSDQRGRRLVVQNAVREGDRILDCGAGTGTTALLAARQGGPNCDVTLFDLSDDMLAVARRKFADAGLTERVRFESGDMVQLPFDNDSFDVVLSTYSLCPIYDPHKAAKELYRVTRPGGRMAIAHSTEPGNKIVKWLADRVEAVVWRLPWLSLGCRAVNVMPTLEAMGGKVVYIKHIGVPLWPFLVFIVEKPAAESS